MPTPQDNRISQLTELNQIASNDYFPILDASDTTQGSLGTTKKIAQLSFSSYSEIVRSSGNNNDDVAINNALSEINKRGSGKLYLPDPSYTVSSSIIPFSNIIVEATGMQSTLIKKVAGGHFDTINVNNISNFGLKNIGINGNKSNGSLGRGINFQNSQDIILEKVYLTDAVEGFKTDTCTDVSFIFCIADGNYEWNFYQFAGTRVKVLYCKSLNAKHFNLEGFGMAFYNNCSYCEAIGNFVYNSAHNGIQVNAGSATQDNLGQILRDNLVVNVQGPKGIFITDDTNSFHVKKASIVNNRVTGGAQKGIYLIDAYDTYVAGNHSWNHSTNDGLTYENCQNITSIGNESDNNNVGLRIVGDGSTITSLCDDIHNNTTNFAPSNSTSGLRTLGPTDFTLDGQSSRISSVGREITPATNGNNWTIQAGGAYPGGTDLGGGTLNLFGGTSTGSSGSRVNIGAAIVGQSSGITDRSPVAFVVVSAFQNQNRVRMSLGTASLGSWDGITLSGQFDYKLGLARNSNANTVGKSLTQSAGGATILATDKAGGNYITQSGMATGVGYSYKQDQTVSPVDTNGVPLPSGTTDGQLLDRLITGAFKTLTNNSVINLLQGNLATNTVLGLIIKYAVEVFDGIELQLETGSIMIQCYNKGDVFSKNTVTQIGSAKNDATLGTLNLIWTISQANPSILSLNANSSLTPSTGYPRITYSIENLTQQSITIL